MDRALELLEEFGDEWDLIEQEFTQVIGRYIDKHSQKEAFELLDKARKVYWDTHNLCLTRSD